LLGRASDVTKKGEVRSIARRIALRANSGRRLALALARLLFALVVVAGMTHSGTRYFYCEALGLMANDPCVEGSRSDGERCPTGALSGHRDDCCEIVSLPSVPNGAHWERLRVPAASVVAIVPAERFVGRALDAEPNVRSFALARWREPPRFPQRARSELMVFLT
jgi:hypothetical protein